MLRNHAIIRLILLGFMTVQKILQNLIMKKNHSDDYFLHRLKIENAKYLLQLQLRNRIADSCKEDCRRENGCEIQGILLFKYKMDKMKNMLQVISHLYWGKRGKSIMILVYLCNPINFKMSLESSRLKHRLLHLLIAIIDNSFFLLIN